MRLEVREFGPIETPRHEDTAYLPATTVPPTVVALRPKRAGTVARAQFPRMGIDPGRHQPMQIFPSMRMEAPEAIITRRGGVTVARATRCTRRVAPGQPSPAAPSRARQRPLGRANPAPRGARVSRGGGSGTLLRWIAPGSGTAPSFRPPRRRPVGHHCRWRRHPPPGAASPGAADVPAVAPWHIGGPVVLHCPQLPRPSPATSAISTRMERWPREHCKPTSRPSTRSTPSSRWTSRPSARC